MKYCRVLLLCLAVMLPWRSAMAVTMVVAPMTSHSASIELESTPCPHNVSPSEHGSSHHDIADHTSCDVCHVPALSADLRSTNPPHSHPVGPPPLIERFASVVLAQHHKPPIPF